MSYLVLGYAVGAVLIGGYAAHLVRRLRQLDAGNEHGPRIKR